MSICYEPTNRNPNTYNVAKNKKDYFILIQPALQFTTTSMLTL